MCGLVAIINKLNNGFTQQGKDNFTNMLYADAIRGMDSTGVFLVNNLGNVTWGKTKHNPVHLFITKEWEDLLASAYKEGRFLVGHNRKATVGKITDNTAHPFVEKHIILVHNGTLTNHKEVGNSEVDSHAICKSIAEKGHIETIKMLQGAFALIWYDINKKALFICRNDKRPLSFVETSDSYYLSSEIGLTRWIVGRNHWGSKIVKEADIETEYLYEFPIERPEEFTKTKLELHKPYSYLTNYQTQNWHEKKNIRETTTTPTTNIINIKETKTDPKYQLGQYVPVYLEDYDQFISTNSKTRNKLFGSTDDEYQTNVEIDYSEELLEFLVTETNIIGKIKQIIYNPATKQKTLTLYPDSIVTGTILESKNKVEIASPNWDIEVHKCSKCADLISFYELPDTIIVKKNKEYIPICNQCQQNTKLKTKKVIHA